MLTGIVWILVIGMALVAVVVVMYMILNEKRHDDSSKYTRSPWRVTSTATPTEHEPTDAEMLVEPLAVEEAGTPAAQTPDTDDEPRRDADAS